MVATMTTTTKISKKDLDAVHGKMVEVKNTPYVLLPASSLAQLMGKTVRIRASKPARGPVEAFAFMDNEIGLSLVAARKAAKLTQAELAEKLNVTQSRVAQTENGTPVSEAYVARVLKACKLPEDWKRKA